MHRWSVSVDTIADSTVGRAVDALPEALRDVLLTGYHRAVRNARYGPEFQSFYRLLEATQWSTPEHARQAQGARLAWVLRRAVTEIPYYAGLGIAGAVNEQVAEDPLRALALFPRLDKETVRLRGAELRTPDGGAELRTPDGGAELRTPDGRVDMLSSDVGAELRAPGSAGGSGCRAEPRTPGAAAGAGCRSARRRYRPVAAHTSGTTGSPLHVACSRAAMQYANACHRHHYSWFGQGLSARIAYFVGHQAAAPQRRRPPFWVTDRLGHERLFSVKHLSPAFAPAYAEALTGFGPDVVVGYPSSLTSLATFCLEQDLRPPRPALVSTLGETLLSWQRRTIAEAFRAPVASFYNSMERVAFIAECPAGRFHVLPQTTVVEVLRPDGTPVGPGEEGELVCTGLIDDYMPLIRYRTGDTGVLAEGECSCGRTGMLLERIGGRIIDVLVAPDGRRVGPVDNAFKEALSIREAQVVQDRRDGVLVRVVMRDGGDERELEHVRRMLAFRIGPDFHIRFQMVDEIPRGPNGKFRFLSVDPALRHEASLRYDLAAEGGC